ncbi:MAG: signal peptidase I [Lachnospiraceae bacterium]|nr:signal peptidase I [Lachnospiraceae bacterium]
MSKHWKHREEPKKTPSEDQVGGWQVPKEEKGGWKKELLEWVKIIVSAALIAFVLNTFIIANSEVPSGSMENTIMTGDRVIGSRLAYLFDEPERGDIVIFRFPDNEKIYYVKRVIGLPGETVDIIDGQVYINDEPLDEPYLREPMVPEAPMHFEVPEDSYFMMGDNRNYSLDARRWKNTYVKRDKLIARVLFRYFPRIGKIE